MRGTLHIIPSAMFNTVASAYNFIGNPAATTRVDQFKVKMKEVVYFSELIMNKLLEHGPMSATNLVTCVQESEVSSSPFKVKPYIGQVDGIFDQCQDCFGAYVLSVTSAVWTWKPCDSCKPNFFGLEN